MIRLVLLVFLGIQLGFQNESFSLPKDGNESVKLADLPTFDNFSAYILATEISKDKTRLGAHNSLLEKNIHHALKEDPEAFLGDLSADAVNLTLKLTNGIYVIQRVDGILTLAAQELAEEASREISKLNENELPPVAQIAVKKIQQIESKRNQLAEYVSKVKNDSNFNQVFEFMIQSQYRKPNRLSQGLMWPAKIQNFLWGKKNPNQFAFQTLKSLCIEVLTGDQKSPVIQVRRLKINSTAQIVPFFKPSLHSWEVEAFYFNKKNERIPAADKPASKH